MVWTVNTTIYLSPGILLHVSHGDNGSDSGDNGTTVGGAEQERGGRSGCAHRDRPAHRFCLHALADAHSAGGQVVDGQALGADSCMDWQGNT